MQAALLRISNLTRQTELSSRTDVADSPKARNKGLLGRTGLLPGEGLWIVPCQSVHTFFMKFPIDLIYIDRNNKVKKVHNNVGPWRISACFSAHSIIELPVGVVKATQTVPGDQLQFSAANLPNDDGRH
jgi:hypothetical protein